MTAVPPNYFVGGTDTVQRSRRAPAPEHVGASQRRSRRFITILVVFALVVGSLAVVLGRSNPGGVLDILSGHTWLPSTDTGTVSLANDATGQVDFNLKVDGTTGKDFTVSQNGNSAILVNRSDGTVGAIDLSKYKVVGTSKAGAGPSIDVVPAGAKIFVVQRNRGIVERRDGLTNKKIAQLRVGKRLTRGVIDDAGHLWVVDAASATLFKISATKSHLVAEPVVDLGGASRELELALVAGNPVVLDLTNAQLVRVVNDEAQDPIKLPIASAEHPVIARTVAGDVTPIALNDAGKLVLVAADGSTTVVPLPDRGGHEFGAPIVFGGRIYVADFDLGQVVSLSADGSVLPGLISVRDGAGPFDVFVNNGSLFINDPKSQTTDAWVVGHDGHPRRVEKSRGDIPTNVDVPPLADLPAPSITPPPRTVAPAPTPRDQPTIAPPSAPAGATADATLGAISVSWGASQENGSPVTGYRVSWTSGAGGGSADVGAGSTNFSVTNGIVNGETYTFSVIALSAAGPSAATVSNAVTPAGPPDVSGVGAGSAGDRTINVNATVANNGGGTPTCHVYLNGAERATQSCDGGFGATIGGLDYATTYDVYIVAENGRGPGPQSNHASARTNDPPPPPPPPPSVSIGRGAPATTGTCTSSACARVNVNISHFPPGNHNVSCSDSDGVFWTYTMSADGAGNGSSAVCIYGFPGRTVTVNVSGQTASMTW